MTLKKIRRTIYIMLIALCLTITTEYTNTFNILKIEAATKPTKPRANRKSTIIYPEKVEIKLTTKTKGGIIYYTTDGKAPTIKSKKYKNKIVLKKDTTLKAITVNKKMQSSVFSIRYKVINITSKDKEDETYSNISRYVKAIKYNGISYLSDTGQKICNKVKNVIATQTNNKMSKAEKAIRIHNYIVLNTEYDNENLSKGFDPPLIAFGVEGVLIKGVAVCQGYAETFQLFMDVMGIESKIVEGYVGKDNIGHAWNMVKLDDEKWYQIDTTWDDPLPDEKGYVGYEYFLINDKEMEKEHIWKTSDYPKCDGEMYSEYALYKEVMKSVKEFEKYFADEYKQGKKYIELAYPEKIRVNEDIIKKYTKKYSCEYVEIENGTIIYITINDIK